MKGLLAFHRSMFTRLLVLALLGSLGGCNSTGGGTKSTPEDSCSSIVSSKCKAPSMVGVKEKTERELKRRLQSWNELKETETNVRSVTFDQFLEDYTARNKNIHDVNHRACVHLAYCECQRGVSNCTVEANHRRSMENKTVEVYIAATAAPPSSALQSSPTLPAPRIRIGSSATMYTIEGTYQLNSLWPKETENFARQELGTQGFEIMLETGRMDITAETSDTGILKFSACNSSMCEWNSFPVSLHRGTLTGAPGWWRGQVSGQPEEASYFSATDLQMDSQFTRELGKTPDAVWKVAQFSEQFLEMIQFFQSYGDWVSTVWLKQ